jgi:hypothetical protein
MHVTSALRLGAICGIARVQIPGTIIAAVEASVRELFCGRDAPAGATIPRTITRQEFEAWEPDDDANVFAIEPRRAVDCGVPGTRSGAAAQGNVEEEQGDDYFIGSLDDVVDEEGSNGGAE